MQRKDQFAVPEFTLPSGRLSFKEQIMHQFGSKCQVEWCGRKTTPACLTIRDTEGEGRTKSQSYDKYLMEVVSSLQAGETRYTVWCQNCVLDFHYMASITPEKPKGDRVYVWNSYMDLDGAMSADWGWVNKILKEGLDFYLVPTDKKVYKYQGYNKPVSFVAHTWADQAKVLGLEQYSVLVSGGQYIPPKLGKFGMSDEEYLKSLEVPADI